MLAVKNALVIKFNGDFIQKSIGIDEMLDSFPNNRELTIAAMIQQSTSVHLTVMGEDAEEIRIAEFPQGRVRLIEIPRSAAPAVKEIPEARVAGILCLLKATPGECRSIRVLACDSLSEQLYAEHRVSPSWNVAILVSLRFATLKPAQLAPFAYRLKQRLAQNKSNLRFTLEEPPGPAPRMAEDAGLEYEQLIEEIPLLAEDLGHILFAPLESKSSRCDESAYRCEARGAYASGYLHAKGFFVLKGSRGHLAASRNPAAALQEELERKGILRREGHSVHFLESHLFPNAALAATAVLGRSSTGFFEWRHPDGLTLGEALRSELTGLT